MNKSIATYQIWTEEAKSGIWHSICSGRMIWNLLLLVHGSECVWARKAHVIQSAVRTCKTAIQFMMWTSRDAVERCTYEISEKLLQPVVHDFVVVPSLYKFGQERTVVCLVESWQDGVLQIFFNTLSVTFVQSLRPIVRRSLSAHIVTFPALHKTSVSWNNAKSLPPNGTKTLLGVFMLSQNALTGITHNENRNKNRQPKWQWHARVNSHVSIVLEEFFLPSFYSVVDEFLEFLDGIFMD